MLKNHCASPGLSIFCLTRRSRFTLIELLVVIAIIAVLAAMLLPALNNAREAGRGSYCLNNYKTLGTANSMYIQDSNGCYLGYWTGWNSDGTICCFPGQNHNIYRYIHTDFKNQWIIGAVYKSGMRNKYACPSFHAEPNNYYATIGINTAWGAAQGLWNNGSVNASYMKKYTVLKSGRAKTSQIAMFMDIYETSTYDGGAGGAGGWNQLALNHKGKVSIGYCDGHAGMLKRCIYVLDKREHSYVNVNHFKYAGPEGLTLWGNTLGD